MAALPKNVMLQPGWTIAPLLPAVVADCPDCKGKGTIQLLNSVVACKCREVSRAAHEPVSLKKIEDRGGVMTLGFRSVTGDIVGEIQIVRFDRDPAELSLRLLSVLDGLIEAADQMFAPAQPAKP